MTVKTEPPMSKWPEYGVWAGMIRRCFNPNDQAYKDYGGRGITVAPEWTGRGGFKKFIEHVGRRPSKKHTLDRLNNDGNYQPGNVEWRTRKQNARNRRNRLVIEAYGQRMLLIEWADELGFPYNVLRNRLNAGWTPEEVVGTPRGCDRSEASDPYQ